MGMKRITKIWNDIDHATDNQNRVVVRAMPWNGGVPDFVSRYALKNGSQKDPKVADKIEPHIQVDQIVHPSGSMRHKDSHELKEDR